MKMKGNIFTVILLMMVSAFITVGAPSAPARAEIEETCEVGIKACRPFRKLPKKMKKCMRLICQDQDRIIEEKKKKISQCEVGYKLCNPLRDEPLYYWTCVHNTCENPPSEDENCQLGHSKCRIGLSQYWSCMSNICNSTYNMFQTCEKGTNECAPELKIYWECVTETCLGDPYKYRAPKYYINSREKTNPVYRFLNDKSYDLHPPDYTAPPLRGVPEKYRYAPEGINPYDWLSAIPAPTRQLKGSAIATYECATPSASINCGDSDISSCQCNDGSMLSLRRSLEQKIIDGKSKTKDKGPRVVNSTYNKPTNSSTKPKNQSTHNPAVNQSINPAYNRPNRFLNIRK